MKTNNFIRAVERAIATHGMLRGGERVGVAVSGGPDSVALLHALHELSTRLDITLGVVHLDHQLRGPESDQDREFVTELARKLEMEADLRSFAVAAEARAAGDNLEQAARKIRYEYFRSLVDGGRYDKIAVGHTRSDQAETVLFRLLRGSGGAGLAAVRPVLGERIIRPLIQTTREDVVAYLARHGYEYRLDSSNLDTSRARNRLRHELLPQLQRDWNPNIINTLANMAEWSRAEEEDWAERLSALAPKHLIGADGALSFDVDLLRPLSLAATRRLMRHAIEQVRGDLLGIDFDHVESLRRLTEEGRGSGQLDLPGLHAQRSLGQVRLTPSPTSTPQAAGSYTVRVDAPGRFSGPWGTSLVTLKLYYRENLAPEQGYNGECRNLLDWEKLPRPLRLRNWRAGDCYHPAGRTGTKKLKSLFHEQRIAAWRRGSWPVLVGDVQTKSPNVAASAEAGGEEIVWARSFGPAERYAAEENSRVLLEISELAPGDDDFLDPSEDAGRLR